ncbi:MAG: TolC family protein [Limnochordia bacterium]|jgi:outer membrane protein TolC|nr:TolC family protein [Limnochordia bacterium]MDD2629730.1 TolC family protein [Limnochordia bacterium]MDD4517497.1 TolC family protein [Limnochordia bacterium]
MRRKTTNLCLIVLLCTIVQIAQASEHPLCLGDAIDLVLTNHPSIKEKNADVAQMTTVIEQIEAGLGWRVDANADVAAEKASKLVQLPYKVNNEESVPEQVNTYIGTVAISRSLFPSPATKAQSTQAQLGKEGALWQLRLTQSNLIVDVVQSYYNVFRAKDALVLTQQALSNAKTAVQVAEDKRKAKTATERDVLLAKTEYLECQAGVTAAEHALDLALRQFTSLIGKPGLTLADIKSPGISIEAAKDPSPWQWTLDRAIEAALKHRPEINLAKIAISAKEQDLLNAKAQSRPTANLAASYQWGEQKQQVTSSIDSSGRFITALSKWDTNLPPLEPRELTDDEWSKIEESWEELFGPDFEWQPNREQINRLMNAGMEEIQPTEDNWNIAFKINLNIFDSGLVRKGVEKAQQEKEKAKANYELIAQLIELEVSASYNDLLQAHNRIQTVSSQLHQAQALYEDSLATKAYSALTPLEEKRLETLVLSEENALKQAYYDHEIAKVKLGTAMGLDPEWLLSVLAF